MRRTIIFSGRSIDQVHCYALISQPVSPRWHCCMDYVMTCRYGSDSALGGVAYGGSGVGHMDRLQPLQEEAGDYAVASEPKRDARRGSMAAARRGSVVEWQTGRNSRPHDKIDCFPSVICEALTCSPCCSAVLGNMDIAADTLRNSSGPPHGHSAGSATSTMAAAATFNRRSQRAKKSTKKLFQEQVSGQ